MRRDDSAQSCGTVHLNAQLRPNCLASVATNEISSSTCALLALVIFEMDDDMVTCIMEARDGVLEENLALVSVLCCPPENRLEAKQG